MWAGNWPEQYNEHYINRKRDYTILIGSDKHNVPGEVPQAFRCFLSVAEDLKPDYIVINGDWFDLGSIARFHRIGWQQSYTVAEELEEGVECLTAIEHASPKSKFVFALGNHDMRFDGKLANCVPEFEGVKGTRLSDHIKGWDMCTSAVFNDSFIVKHRWHAGVHSSYNDVLKGGKNIATGHDHKLNVRPWTDYNGTRYGIKTGTLSDLWDDSFMYMENNASDWQPGFVVVRVFDNVIQATTCPVVIDKLHKKRGQVFFEGKWYG
jgi:hypothetical protein